MNYGGGRGCASSTHCSCSRYIGRRANIRCGKWTGHILIIDTVVVGIFIAVAVIATLWRQFCRCFCTITKYIFW